jgi:hypothetical protein
VRFPVPGPDKARLEAGRTALVVDHPEYHATSVLGEATCKELLGDLRGEITPIPLP